MAIKIGSNFTFQGEQPNFERDRFATKADMKAFPETSIDDGHLSYCMEDKNTYQFKSSNAVDVTTGKWRLFKADVDLSAYATKDSVNNELNKKVNIGGISKGNTIEGKAAYLKVATITMPKTQYQSGLLELFIADRSNERVDVLVSMDNTRGQTNPVVNVVEIAYRASINTQPIYYYKDLSGEVPIITLYFKITAYDTATAKVVDKGAYMPFTYTLDMEVLQTLPEGITQVHHINYGSKHLFYATPKDVAGDPKFRAIDITDIPDLSGKYGTKAEITTINSSITDIRTSLESTQIDFSDLRNKVNAMPKTVFITQAAYDALSPKDANTIYYING